MKKAAALLLTILVLMSGVAVLAAGGTAEDPLISLSYLNGTYLPGAIAQAGERVNTKTQQTYQSVRKGLDAKQSGYLARLAGNGVESGGQTGLRDQRVKRGDVLSLSTGSGVLLLAGSAVVSYASGAVIDLTAGQAAPSGTSLTPQHRYLTAENTMAVLAVSSDTAVLSLEGNFTLAPSGETDYNALAVALGHMGIFRGTGTGYGAGYDLEKVPTRIEGLIMFLRLMGEENAALAYMGSTDFMDVPDWCKSYVAYASDRGYTNGVGLDTAGRPCFGTTRSIGAGEYSTFILRALGYHDGGDSPDFTWNTALEKGISTGVLTEGEHSRLTGTPFFRAQVAYLSYFSLDALMKDKSGTLLDHLSAAGALNGTDVRAVMSGIGVQRIS